MVEKTDKPLDLLEMTVGSAIFYLAWPTIIAVLLQNLATTIDMIMVGRLGPADVAAVGFSSMIFWLLSALIIGIEVSITAIVARAIGAGIPEEASLGVGQSYLLGISASVVMATATFFLAPTIFKLFGVEPDVFNLSVPYLRILCFGQVFLSIISTSSGALRGAGDTRTPMLIGIGVTILHVGLNYVLILGKFGFPSYGVKGAAIGTLISSIAGAVVFLILMFSGRLRLGISIKDFRLNLKRSWQVTRLALPAAAEMIVLQLGLLIYAKFIVTYGTTALSGYQVGMQILSLSFIPNTGFGAAASTLVGQNLGANRRKTAKKTGWICTFWAVLSMGLLGVIGFFIAPQLASIFIQDPEVIDVAVSFIRAVAICQGGMALYFTLAGALRGAGDTRSPLLITLMGMYVFRIPAAWVMSQHLAMAVEAVFSLLIVDYIVRGTAIVLRYTKGKWMDTKL